MTTSDKLKKFNIPEMQFAGQYKQSEAIQSTLHKYKNYKLTSGHECARPEYPKSFLVRSQSKKSEKVKFT